MNELISHDKYLNHFEIFGKNKKKLLRGIADLDVEAFTSIVY